MTKTLTRPCESCWEDFTATVYQWAKKYCRKCASKIHKLRGAISNNKDPERLAALRKELDDLINT